MTLVPVNKETLGKKRLKPVTNYAFISKQPFCEIFAAESASVALTTPIFFMEKDGRTMPIALFALQAQDNLMVRADGSWGGDYVPAMLRLYPFSVGRDESASKPILLLDDASGLLSDSEGEVLYGEGDSKEAEFAGVVGRAIQLISQLEGQSLYTKNLTDKIVQAGLLEPATVTFQEGGEQKTATGLLSVNQEKFAALSDDTFLAMRKSGVLPLVYAHFVSLGLVQRLQARLNARAVAGRLN